MCASCFFVNHFILRFFLLAVCTAKSHFAAPLQPSAPGAEPEPPSGCYATGARGSVLRWWNTFWYSPMLGRKSCENLQSVKGPVQYKSRPGNNMVSSSDGVEYSTSEYEYCKKLRVRVRVLILKNVLEYEYRKKVRVRVLLQVKQTKF